MKGVIEMYHPKKLWGFVRDNNGQKYFFHKDNCAKGFNPQLGAPVEFNIAPPYVVGKPDQAVDVRNVYTDVSTSVSTEGEDNGGSR